LCTDIGFGSFIHCNLWATSETTGLSRDSNESCLIRGGEGLDGPLELAGGADILADKIASRTAVVCVIGLGYVGIPQAVASAQAGFNVLGVDIDDSRVEQINRGVCYVEDPYSQGLLSSLVSSGKIKAYSKLEEAVPKSDIVIICVPTPLKRNGEPDLSFLESTGRALANHLIEYKLVIVESTSYPGTTEEVFRPLVERGGKRATRDFGLVYSPERIDYGNSSFAIRNIPKVVGGVNAESAKLGEMFYGRILQAPIVKVSSPSVAEACKMLENVFRYVNIALVNELAVLHERLGVDFIEAVGAAATKPFGFLAHYPGPGVGGHCIPKDPFYLVYQARKAGLPMRMISVAESINSEMPRRTIERLMSTLNGRKTNSKNLTVALWGISYKGGVRDMRKSPSVELLKILKRLDIKIVIYDPLVERITVGSVEYASSSSILDSVEGADALVIVTNHLAFRDVDLSEVRVRMNVDPILFDTRNLREREECEKAGFTYLATGRP